MTATVLVTGATGKTGRRLIPVLLRRGAAVRAASRAPGPARAGLEPVRFDWTDPGTYAAARQGVDAVYLVTGNSPRPEDAERVSALLDGASGLRRAVLLSVFGVDQTPAENPLRRIEMAVESSGVPATILRPGAFMQNFSEEHFIRARESIRDRDEIATPGGDGVVSWVSTEDIAAVAAAALTADGHEGRAYAPVGPEALTMADVAEHISAASGRRIRYVHTDHTPLREELLAAGVEPAAAEHNSRLYAYAMSTGAFGVLNDDVRQVTGRPPVSFAEFAVGAAAAWRG